MEEEFQYWWKLPENQIWRKFLSRMIWIGTGIITTWTALFFSIGYFSSLDEWDHSNSSLFDAYKIWQTSTLAIIVCYCVYWFVIGMSVYRKSGANVRFSPGQMVSFTTFIPTVLWFWTFMYFYRVDYKPSIGLALFDLALMPGLMICIWGLLHIVIILICRPDAAQRSDGIV